MDDKSYAAQQFNEELLQLTASYQNGSRTEAYGMHSCSDWSGNNFPMPAMLFSSPSLPHSFQPFSNNNNNTVMYQYGMMTSLAADATPTPTPTDPPLTGIPSTNGSGVMRPGANPLNGSGNGISAGTGGGFGVGAGFGNGLFVNTSPGHCSSVSTPESLRSDLNCAVSSGSTNVSASSILATNFPLLTAAHFDQDDVCVDNLHPQSQSQSSPSSLSPPSTENFSGKYNFEISLPPNGGRAASWIYSEKLNKLYVHISSACPIRVRTSRLQFTDCILRASAVYIRPEHANEPVRCCIHHQSKDVEPGGNHLIRVALGNASYVEDPTSKRQSVIVPFQPQADWTTFLFQFSCFSSCPGGQNRRPMRVVFTLERLVRKNTDDGATQMHFAVLGRSSLEVRTCACPRRDAKWDDDMLANNGAQIPEASLTSQSSTDVSARIGNRVRRSSLSTAAQYTLTVRGSDNFRLLKRIRDALEIADSITERERRKRSSVKSKRKKRVESESVQNLNGNLNLNLNSHRNLNLEFLTSASDSFDAAQVRSSSTHDDDDEEDENDSDCRDGEAEDEDNFDPGESR